jgi:hypothetical protein
MTAFSHAPEGFEYFCPICRKRFIGQPYEPTGELFCPDCGSIAFVAIDLAKVPVGATHEIPESIVKEHRIFPLHRRDDTIFIATREVKDADFVEVLSYILASNVCFVIGDSDSIEAAIHKVYG